MPLISVIVCSKQDHSWDDHERNIKKTVMESHEYIRIDNRFNAHSLCSAYNEGVSKALGEILVFVDGGCCRGVIEIK